MSETECTATAVSMSDDTHTHTCAGRHDGGYHLCPDPKCRRWWWRKKEDT